MTLYPAESPEKTALKAAGRKVAEAHEALEAAMREYREALGETEKKENRLNACGGSDSCCQGFCRAKY